MKKRFKKMYSKHNINNVNMNRRKFENYTEYKYIQERFTNRNNRKEKNEH